MQISARLPRETARDFAIRVIRENIVQTILEPGCMVSENELATEMGLSRTPVREALIELSKSGIVEIYPQHGSMVSKIDYDKVEEASFTRLVLELAVTELVCDMAMESDFAALDENLSLQRLYLERDAAEKLMAADNEFHRRLFEIARKRISYELVSSLSTHFDRVRQLSLVMTRHTGVVEDHQAILDALRKRDKPAAAEAMRIHLSRYRVDRSEIEERYKQFMAD